MGKFGSILGNLSSYFETDESEVEEDYLEEEEVVKPAPQKAQVNQTVERSEEPKVVAPEKKAKPVPAVQQTERVQQTRQAARHSQVAHTADRQPNRVVERTPVQHTASPVYEVEKPVNRRPDIEKRTAKRTKDNNVTPLHQSTERMTPSRSQNSQSEHEENTTIVLKYPRRYEDAVEIVDLLIENECVLIDFQFMLEAQARRCLDYLDGASHVLFGKLQKVGSSMFLLTPMNVVVDMDDMNIPTSTQESSFDFDMKRR